MSALRLGVIPDFREEKWISMDICADALLREIAAGAGGGVHATSVRPEFQKRFMRVPKWIKTGTAFNADRVINRMFYYPHALRKVARDFDCFHVCDHAYANAVHVLPAEQTGAFCHDLDTFRCLLEPAKEPRPRWFKAMMRRVLSGMAKAAVVFHTTAEIRRQIVAHGIVDEKRLVQVPLGVSSVCSPLDPGSDGGNAILRRVAGRPFVLHVGSCIPRKRIDVLLHTFAGLKARHAELLLVKVGGPLMPEQAELLARLGLEVSTILVDRQSESELAALYRSAALLLQPSDAEGFGLPVIEALACGCAVVASAIPTMQEVGGDAAVYCPVADISCWVETVDRLLKDPNAAPAKALRVARAGGYAWSDHARIICDAYRTLMA